MSWAVKTLIWQAKVQVQSIFTKLVVEREGSGDYQQLLGIDVSDWETQQQLQTP